MKENIINSIKSGLFVSCQARVGWPMEGASIMSAYANAAEIGGAIGIRATGSDNIKAIQQKTNLPILAINKVWYEGNNVYITPTISDAKEILDLGIEMIAVDITNRERPKESVIEILEYIQVNYPQVVVVGEIDCVSVLTGDILAKIDMVSTTLKGYTPGTEDYKKYDTTLISEIKEVCELPIVAEGKIDTPENARAALDAGAHCVVVGTAITIPERITERFIKEMENE